MSPAAHRETVFVPLSSGQEKTILSVFAQIEPLERGSSLGAADVDDLNGDAGLACAAWVSDQQVVSTNAHAAVAISIDFIEGILLGFFSYLRASFELAAIALGARPSCY
jgi:hypothetical protein